MRAAPDPRALTRVVWASPHVLRFPLRAFLRFPVCPPGSSPSSAFLWFPFVRRSPVRSLRPLPGSGSPSVSLRVPFPLSNLHLSAAARRFRRRRPGRQGPTSPVLPRPPRLNRALRLNYGRASAGQDGMPSQNRLFCALGGRGCFVLADGIERTRLVKCGAGQPADRDGEDAGAGSGRPGSCGEPGRDERGPGMSASWLWPAGRCRRGVQGADLLVEQGQEPVVAGQQVCVAGQAD